MTTFSELIGLRKAVRHNVLQGPAEKPGSVQQPCGHWWLDVAVLVWLAGSSGEAPEGVRLRSGDSADSRP